MEDVLIEKPKKKSKSKIMRPSNIINKKREFIDIAGLIGASLGKIEVGSKIFITGRSYSGKSSFVTKLCALMAGHVKVDYNNHEEKGGDAATVVEKMMQAGIDKSFDGKIRFYKAPISSDTEETFADILSKKNSAGFAVLDSLQHARMGKADYIDFTNKFCNAKRRKIIVFISHWQKNDYVMHIKHDCDIKLEVMKYVVYVESRMPGATNKPIVIWEEGAKKAWGKNYTRVVNGNFWPGIKK